MFSADRPDRDGDGVYGVSVRATDVTGLSAVASTTVTVSNIAPTVSLVPAVLKLDPGEFGAFTVSFSDPGPDSWTMRVVFGDGTFLDRLPGSPVALPVTHAWARPGTYQVRVTVQDDDGRSRAAAVATVAVASPEDSIRWLIREVEDLRRRGELRRGQAYSLIGKLQLASGSSSSPTGRGWPR